jgi:hypothetical protein
MFEPYQPSRRDTVAAVSFSWPGDFLFGVGVVVQSDRLFVTVSKQVGTCAPWREHTTVPQGNHHPEKNGGSEQSHTVRMV